jgi:hypothetical protein
MIKTLMQGLNEKDIQAVVNTYDLKSYYYPTLFPLQPQSTLTWKALEAQAGLKIAADVVSFNASIPKKTRDAISRLDGDIPKIGISREKLESDLNEYRIMLALAQGDTSKMELVNFWAEDTEFVWNGVASRLEWIALRQLSTGKVSYTTGNNASVVSQYDIDYAIPSAQKVGFFSGSASWAAGSTAKPISKDFVGAVKLAKSKGINLKVAWMNADNFANFVAQTEVIQMCASFAQNALSIAQTPDLATVNAALSRNPYLYGLQIRVIDQDITIELPDGTRTTGNPFEDNVVSFTESAVLGKTYYAPLADEIIEGSVAMKVKRGHTLIKKYAEESPVREVTEGLANAFPGWNGSGRAILLQTNNATSWAK